MIHQLRASGAIQGHYGILVLWILVAYLLLTVIVLAGTKFVMHGHLCSVYCATGLT